jgi:hypothetical protein
VVPNFQKSYNVLLNSQKVAKTDKTATKDLVEIGFFWILRFKIFLNTILLWFCLIWCYFFFLHKFGAQENDCRVESAKLIELRLTIHKRNDNVCSQAKAQTKPSHLIYRKNKSIKFLQFSILNTYKNLETANGKF